MSAVSKESEVFSDCTRAQLTTSAHKPCTYFATYKGERVFVKGPYTHRVDAERHVWVHRLKHAMFPELDTIRARVLELEVCVEEKAEIAKLITKQKEGTRVYTDTTVSVGFLGFQFGARKRWMRGDMNGKPGFFIVFEDALSEKKLHTRMYRSDIAWPVPVEVVDFDRTLASRDIVHPWQTRVYEKSFWGDDKMSKCKTPLAFHIALTWLLGCGKDWPVRNFILYPKQSRVVQVDLDIAGDFDFAPIEMTMLARADGAKHFAKYARTVTSEFQRFRARVVDAVRNDPVVRDLLEKSRDLGAPNVTPAALEARVKTLIDDDGKVDLHAMFVC